MGGMIELTWFRPRPSLSKAKDLRTREWKFLEPRERKTAETKTSDILIDSEWEWEFPGREENVSPSELRRTSSQYDRMSYPWSQNFALA